jgi:hypothetical protein
VFFSQRKATKRRSGSILNTQTRAHRVSLYTFSFTRGIGVESVQLGSHR